MSTLFFQTFGVDGIDHPLSARAEFSLEDAAVSFVQSRLNVTSDVVAYRTGYANDVAQHAYIHQQIVRHRRYLWHLQDMPSYARFFAEWHSDRERRRQRRVQQGQQSRVLRVLVRQAL